MINKNLRKKLGIVCLALAMTGLYACGKTDDSKNAEQKLSSTIKNTPKTGDSIPLKIVAALVLISLCSVVYILYRKKGS